MIIDAKGLVLGRVATTAAKKALLGEEIQIVNCDLAVVSGTRDQVFGIYKRKRELGTFKGPFYHRRSDRLVRRTVRGMLPYKQPRGKEAFGRVMCFVGVPDALKDKKAVSLPGSESSKLPHAKFVSISEIAKMLGGKV